MSDAALEAAKALGYMSFPVFRHRELGLRVPYQVHHLVGDFDLTRVNIDALTPEVRNGWLGSAIAEIQKNYVFDGLIDSDHFRESVSDILSRVPDSAHAFVLGPSEKRPTPDGRLENDPVKIKHNRQLSEIVADCPNVTLLAMDDYVADFSERNADPNHFARQVYFRLFEDVRRRIDELAIATEEPFVIHC